MTSTSSARKRFRLLVLQHVEAEHLGRFGPFFVSDGVEIVTIQLDRGDSIPALDTFDGIWVLGGPMQVWQEDKYPWLKDEKAAWIVEPIDILEDRAFCLTACVSFVAPDQLSLDGFEERFNHRLDVAIAFAAHRHLEAMLLQTLLVLV